ncbi:MAG TPA: hypothetical protein VG097_13630 [Gemmata sp.]|jgi:hypothetical protein|nr:hypothetical protein [Gemmata sp.]
MAHRPLYLIDQSAARLADLDVSLVGDHFEGTISLEATPPQLKRLFREYEEIVEGQTFSLLDEIEQKLNALQVRTVFDDGSVVNVCDLQIFPSTNSVSFKTRQPIPV